MARKRTSMKGMGADAFFEKPFCRELINAQVNNVMANRARIKYYFAHTLFAYMDVPARSYRLSSMLKVPTVAFEPFPSGSSHCTEAPVGRWM